MPEMRKEIADAWARIRAERNELVRRAMLPCTDAAECEARFTEVAARTAATRVWQHRVEAGAVGH